MGLDMFAFRVKRTKVESTEFLEESGLLEGKPEELQNWRKHPNLHGLMEKIYYEKTEDPVETFNCVDVFLDKEDIERIEKAVNEDCLPETSGFFFGQSCPEDKEGDLEFIKKAKEALEEGYEVFYTSWW